MSVWLLGVHVRVLHHGGCVSPPSWCWLLDFGRNDSGFGHGECDSHEDDDDDGAGAGDVD